MNEVLIVGAGPTGLTLAAELLRRNVAVRLIDQAQGPSTHSKALAIHARTLELFDKMGVIDAFLEKGLKIEEITVHYQSKLTTFSLKGLESPYPFALILPQSETERLLLAQVERLGGRVEWQTRFVDWEEKKAVLQHADGHTEQAAVEWMVGCDGARSQVRHALNFSFGGSDFPETFLIADITAEASLLQGMHVFLSKEGPSLIVNHTSPAMYRLIFPDFRIDEQGIDTVFLQKVLKECNVPLKVSSSLWVSLFKIHRRCVNRMRHENVFLAGDAAHIHSPAGGQGMNTSIQDAFNLAWKLHLVQKEGSSPLLLDTYDQERLPIAKKVLKGTSFLTLALLFFQKKGAPVFFELIKKLFLFKESLSHTLSGLAISYKTNPLLFQSFRNRMWKGPQPGERAPHVLLGDGLPLFHYFRSIHHILLLFEEHSTLIQKVQNAFGEWIQVVVMKEEDVKKTYAAGSKSLYLIRPDGIIGYRSRIFRTEEVFNYLNGVFTSSQDRK